MREAPGSGKVQAPVCPSLPSLASPSRGWVLLPAHPGAVEASGTRAAPGFSLPKSLPAPKIPSPFPCAALGSHTAGNARAGAGDSPGGASRSDLVRLSVRPSHPLPFPRPGIASLHPQGSSTSWERSASCPRVPLAPPRSPAANPERDFPPGSRGPSGAGRPPLRAGKSGTEFPGQHPAAPASPPAPEQPSSFCLCGAPSASHTHSQSPFPIPACCCTT